MNKQTKSKQTRKQTNNYNEQTHKPTTGSPVASPRMQRARYSKQTNKQTKCPPAAWSRLPRAKFSSLTHLHTHHLLFYPVFTHIWHRLPHIWHPYYITIICIFAPGFTRNWWCITKPLSGMKAARWASCFELHPSVYNHLPLLHEILLSKPHSPFEKFRRKRFTFLKEIFLRRKTISSSHFLLGTSR